MLTEWKKSVEGQWFSIREEWATERVRSRGMGVQGAERRD